MTRVGDKATPECEDSFVAGNLPQPIYGRAAISSLHILHGAVSRSDASGFWNREAILGIICS